MTVSLKPCALCLKQGHGLPEVDQGSFVMLKVLNDANKFITHGWFSCLF
jgi:hypothetical protein